MFVQLIVVLIILVPILAIVLDSDLGKALAGRLGDRRLEAGDDIVADRIGYLEGEIDRLSKEVMRLDEESQFLHKLLAERPAKNAAQLPSGDTPDGDDAGGS